MTKLTKNEREILLEIEDELLADIEMLEKNYAEVSELNSKTELNKEDLSSEILNVLNRKIATQKIDLCFGTKVYDYKKNEIAILIKTWVNKFADGDVDYATLVDANGKKYATPLDNVSPIEG